jgi:hypothetical protein
MYKEYLQAKTNLLLYTPAIGAVAGDGDGVGTLQRYATMALVHSFLSSRIPVRQLVTCPFLFFPFFFFPFLFFL